MRLPSDQIAEIAEIAEIASFFFLPHSLLLFSPKRWLNAK